MELLSGEVDKKKLITVSKISRNYEVTYYNTDNILHVVISITESVTCVGGRRRYIIIIICALPYRTNVDLYADEKNYETLIHEYK